MSDKQMTGHDWFIAFTDEANKMIPQQISELATSGSAMFAYMMKCARKISGVEHVTK